MRRLGRMRLVAAVTLLAFTCAGCAARWAYRQGRDAADRGDWDLAVARLTRAVDKDPQNIGYRIALENARIEASRFHYDQARQHLAANDLARAAAELEIASNYDPANRSAADDLAIVRRRIEEQRQEQREREGLAEVRARAAARPPVPVLSPRSTLPISVRFEETSLQNIFETLAKVAGVNVVFDQSFREKKTSVELKGVSFEQALDRLTTVNQLFYKVLDQNTIIIVGESTRNRRKYEDVLLRTFYLQNAEASDILQLIKTLTRLTTAGQNKELGAITVIGTIDQIAMAERIIEANDKALGEVVVEVQILEVNRTNLREWGINLSNYSASATLSPTGAANEISEGGTLNLRAYLLSSLNQADWVVSIPSSIFTRFIHNNSSVRILATPRLRAAEGKKTQLRIGTEVPVPVTSIGVGSVGQTGTYGGYYPATSFQYKTVGVEMDLTPHVAASGDITLEMTAEFSLLGGDRNVGTEGNPLQVPTFLSRAVDAHLRLRDGETGLIGGLLQTTESATFAGSLGMESIPIIGKLLGKRDRKEEEWEVLISLTPRIVRAPKLSEEDFVPLRVGTLQEWRVEGARPPLFGEEPEPAAAPAPAPETPPTMPPMTTPERATPPAAAAPLVPGTPETSAAAPASAPDTSPRPPSRPLSVLLRPPEVSLREGQQAGFAVQALGGEDILWVELILRYDPTLVQFSDISPGSLLTLDGSAIQREQSLESGRARVRFARPTPVSGSGDVAAITLRGVTPGQGMLAVEAVTIGRADGTGVTPPVPSPARLVVAP